MGTNDIGFWEELYKKQGASCQSPYTELLHRKIKSLIPSDVKTVLDAGCGGGALMLFLMGDTNLNVQGVDQSIEGVKHITETLKLNATVGDLSDLSQIKDDAFDLVVCSEVLEHIPMADLEKVVTEMCRVAKKYVITTNPYKEVLTFQHINCTHCFAKYHPAGHLHRVDEKFITNLFRPCSSEISFHYSGERLYTSAIFSSVLRMFGYRLFSLESRCPLCKTLVIRKKWKLLARIIGNVNKIVQNMLKNAGVKKHANIISFIKLIK